MSQQYLLSTYKVQSSLLTGLRSRSWPSILASCLFEAYFLTCSSRSRTGRSKAGGEARHMKGRLFPSLFHDHWTSHLACSTLQGHPWEALPQIRVTWLLHEYSIWIVQIDLDEVGLVNPSSKCRATCSNLQILRQCQWSLIIASKNCSG